MGGEKSYIAKQKKVWKRIDSDHTKVIDLVAAITCSTGRMSWPCDSIWQDHVPSIPSVYKGIPKNIEGLGPIYRACGYMNTSARIK